MEGVHEKGQRKDQGDRMFECKIIDDAPSPQLKSPSTYIWANPLTDKRIAKRGSTLCRNRTLLTLRVESGIGRYAQWTYPYYEVFETFHKVQVTVDIARIARSLFVNF
jgi:hypothetical protein